MIPLGAGVQGDVPLTHPGSDHSRELDACRCVPAGKSSETPAMSERHQVSDTCAAVYRDPAVSHACADRLCCHCA